MVFEPFSFSHSAAAQAVFASKPRDYCGKNGVGRRPLLTCCLPIFYELPKS